MRLSAKAIGIVRISGHSLGAFIIHGITPGPNVIDNEPALFWGLIVSMWVGNLLLIMLNLPLIGIWVKFLTIPYRILFPAIVAFACIGTYSLNLNAFDVFAIAFFGILGYFLIKLGCERAPLLLGFILGPLLEQHLRRALIISHGDPTIFLTRPVSLALVAAAVIVFVIAVLPSIRRKREVVFQEEDPSDQAPGQLVREPERHLNQVRACRSYVLAETSPSGTSPSLDTTTRSRPPALAR